MQITVYINNELVKKDVDVNLRLLDFLRQEGCASVKCGCETTNCGLCTVWVDGTAMLSCSLLAVRADGCHITTLEGLQEKAKDFADFMAREGAEQCGYCSPGLIMQVLALRKEAIETKKVFTIEEVKRYLAGNLCRCTGYMGQLRAITKYLGKEGVL